MSTSVSDARGLIQRLHQVYIELTGMAVSMSFQREHQWYEWVRHGFTEADLRDMVRYLKKAIANGERRIGSLKFNNLIGNPDYFEEDLAIIHAERRNARKWGERESMLAATGRPPTPKSPDGRPVGEILAQVTPKHWEDLRKQAFL